MRLADRIDQAPVIVPIRSRISATPYACRDPKTIPPRPWIYGRQFLRGSLSVIVSPGAVGKTTLLTSGIQATHASIAGLMPVMHRAS
jgi:hypothetical protein